MEITAKGKIKHDKLVAKKSLNREQRLNMWVFTTITKYSDLDQEFLVRYLDQGGDNIYWQQEKRDYFWNMVQRKEIIETELLPWPTL